MGNIKFNNFLFTLFHLKLRDIIAISLTRLYSINHFYILKRNLSIPFENKARPDITVNKIDGADINDIIKGIKYLDGNSKKEIISRLLFYKAGFKNCYIAKTKAGEIAFLQWLVFPSENEVIRKYFSRKFYPVEEGQVMIENAFTFPKFRGLGILPRVTQELLTIAKESGHASAVTYIRKDKIASLNEFIKMRFKITKLIKEFKLIGLTIRKL